MDKKFSATVPLTAPTATVEDVKVSLEYHKDVQESLFVILKEREREMKMTKEMFEKTREKLEALERAYGRDSAQVFYQYKTCQSYLSSHLRSTSLYEAAFHDAYTVANHIGVLKETIAKLESNSLPTNFSGENLFNPFFGEKKKKPEGN